MLDTVTALAVPIAAKYPISLLKQSKIDIIAEDRRRHIRQIHEIVYGRVIRDRLNGIRRLIRTLKIDPSDMTKISAIMMMMDSTISICEGGDDVTA